MGNRVANGQYPEHAELPIDMSAIKRLTLPSTATFDFNSPTAVIKFDIIKTLNYGGKPPMPITAETVHRSMGLAYRIKADLLEVATWGEWESNVDGTASMSLTCAVPKGIKVELSASLCGEQSLATGISCAVDYGDSWFGCRQPSSEWKDIHRVY